MDQGIKRKLAGVVWVYPTPAFDEPIMQLYTVTYSKARTQLFGEYTELDQLMEKTVAEMDQNKRWALQKDIGKWMYDNAIAIPIAYADMLWAASPKLEWVSLPGQVTVAACGAPEIVEPLPEGCRRSDNQTAFIGATRLWEGADMVARPVGTTWRIEVTPAPERTQ